MSKYENQVISYILAFEFPTETFYVTTQAYDWEQYSKAEGYLFSLVKDKKDAVYKPAKELKTIHVQQYATPDEAAKEQRIYGTGQTYKPVSVRCI